MSKILAEQLLAGIILGDNDNQEYIYLPGGEVGSDNPCAFLKAGTGRQDPAAGGSRRAGQATALKTCQPSGNGPPFLLNITKNTKPTTPSAVGFFYCHFLLLQPLP